jgi:hypothetical protein
MPNVSKLRATKPRTAGADGHIRVGQKAEVACSRARDVELILATDSAYDSAETLGVAPQRARARHREDLCLCQVAAERKKIEMLFAHLKRILRPPLEAALMKRQALAGLRYVGAFKSRTSNYRSRHSLIASAAGTIRG